MELRPELLPPVLDEELVARLAKLATRLDGYQDDDELAEFNRLAGTDLPMEEFQGIYGAMDHNDWVRDVLTRQQLRPAVGVTREELAEVVRRAMPTTEEYFDECDLYQAVFDANVSLEGASNLIFYPPDYDPKTNTWGGGRPISEYDPTPEQIVEWALTLGASEQAERRGTS